MEAAAAKAKKAVEEAAAEKAKADEASKKPALEAATLESYGGGWTFVNEPGRSKEDVDDVATILPESYYLPVYQVTQPFKEVLVQRISANWCDSWGRQTGHWVSSEGASMGVQADCEYLCTYNNEGGRHIWLRQPTSYLGAGNCNRC